MESQPLRRFRLSPQVYLLGLAAMLNDVSSDIIYPLLPIFLSTYIGATPLVIGMIEGVAEAVASLLKFAAGWWSDRLPQRKPLIVLGYLLAAGSRAMIATAGRWPSVLAARLVDRTGKGIRSAPRDAMICDVTPVEQRGRAFGMHRALDHAGAVVGPFVAALLVGVLHLDLRTIFLIAVVPAAIGAIALLFLLKETRREAALAEPKEVEPAAPLPRSFWLSIASVALFYLANSSDVFLILRAHEVGVATAWIPLLWGVHHVVRTAFTAKAGMHSDRGDRRSLLIAGWSIYAAIYLLFPLSQSLPVFLFLFVAYAVPFTLTEAVERAWISDAIDARSRGKAFGIYYLTMGISTLAGTLIFGFLYQTIGAVAAFWTGATIAAVAAASVAAQKWRRRRAT